MSKSNLSKAFYLIIFLFGLTMAPLSAVALEEADINKMRQEAKSVKAETNKQANVTEVIRKYIPEDTPKDEVLNLLRENGFKLYKNDNPRDFVEEKWEEAWSASVILQKYWFLFIPYGDNRLVMHMRFDDDKLKVIVGVTSKTFL